MSDAREPDPPPALRDELARLWSPGPPPPRVEEALRAAAREHLGDAPGPKAETGARTGPRRRPWIPVVAAAAAAGLALVLWPRDRADRTPREVRTAALAPADVNGDRVVDILDAHDLARRLARGDAADLAPFDLNRDGAVDDRDVDRVAREAVRLDR